MKKLLLLLALTLSVFVGCEKPQESGEVTFPESNTLTIIVPTSAGSGMDVRSRVIAKHLAEELGKNVVVENVAGGASVIASTQFLAEDPNSDYIINLSTDHMVISPVLQEADYSQDSFIPLLAASYSEEYFWVSTDSPWNNWEDVQNASKENAIIFGTGAKTGPIYVATRFASDVSNVDMEVVIANSIPESIANMLGGHVDITWSSYATAKDYYIAGKIKPIVGTGLSDADELNVDTIKGLGYDFNFSSCNVYAIRNDTDSEKVAIIKEALQKVYASPEFIVDWINTGESIIKDPSAEFAKKGMQQKINLLPKVKALLK